MYHKVVYRSYTCGLLIQCKILACEVRVCTEEKNFEIVFGFKSDTSVLTFSFHFHFSFLICFSFPGHLVGFILLGKGFGNAFTILGLDQRKGRWVVKQDYRGNF